ncbi:retrovirus-related Pol polyprotein from transposon TNT 1-94 [Diospyros lotus]|uniref:retrovirus-related Pol polyprotein from transposon TNT 1-94 n=1 Tax=Diospyros lotus TaxID=55363 RepID=UPI00225A6B88|nr:retrovirus-related Pol polyprotein from transposon TNT 1-94 [Diospyros lotus]
MASEKDSYKIEKFDGSNFRFWKMQMEDYLYQKDLYLPLDMKLQNMKDEEWKVLDRKALGAIRLSLMRSVAFNVKDQDTIAGLIKALFNMYEQPSAAQKGIKGE